MAIDWEYLGEEPLPPGALFPKRIETWRAKVPGGWLVLSIKKNNQEDSLSTLFYPDPQHDWDGSSLP